MSSMSPTVWKTKVSHGSCEHKEAHTSNTRHREVLMELYESAESIGVQRAPTWRSPRFLDASQYPQNFQISRIVLLPSCSQGRNSHRGSWVIHDLRNIRNWQSTRSLTLNRFERSARTHTGSRGFFAYFCVVHESADEVRLEPLQQICSVLEDGFTFGVLSVVLNMFWSAKWNLRQMRQFRISSATYTPYL